MSTFSGHLRGSEGRIQQHGLEDGYDVRLVREGRVLSGFLSTGKKAFEGELIPAGAGFTCELHDLVIRGDLFRVTGTRGADGYALAVEVVVHESRRFPWEMVG